ncbi:MAG: NTP transferase domain-containing protein [Muricomes sp.]
MSYNVDNAIIMAAGTSSRFAPLSYEKPKALIDVKGEVLIERQIRQLQEAGITQIIIVLGYKKEKFYYLKDKYNVILVENDDYLTRNNNGSIYVVRDYLKNSYICSADNYFTVNPFESCVDDAYYSTLYANGKTSEWCVEEDTQGYICDVKVGGSNAWYMLGHVFWTAAFSKLFVEILLKEYSIPGTAGLLWEAIYMKHLDKLKLKVRRYEPEFIFEFDTLDELREFDKTYVNNTRSIILKQVAQELRCIESEIKNISAIKSNNTEQIGFEFICDSDKYQYTYEKKELKRVI